MQETSKAQVPNYEEVGIRIKELRVSHDLSQKDFAHTLNISQGHLSRVEKGAIISAALCDLIAEKFNTSKEYLLYGVKAKPLGITSSAAPVPKSPSNEFSSFSLEQTDSIAGANKQIKKLLQACNYEYSFVVNEIRDVDSILHTDEQLYPTTSYSFAISVECIPSGYEWVATELKRKESNLEKLEDPHTEIEFKKRVETMGRKYTPRQTAKDTCLFEPYTFRMFSPYDFLDTEYGRFGDIYRYREAKEIALYNGLEIPKDCYDPIVDKLSPDRNVYLADGTIDRKAEFERFKQLIRSGVGGKSLSPSPVRAIEGDWLSSGYGVIYKGRAYSLGSMGRVKITVDAHEYGDSEVQFIIDDKRISASQFIDMLSTYEGWQMSFKFESN
jgi:transcriptional regulator with XRE-family HTH domain